MFDTFVMVDWSAANQRKKGRDSIWIAWLGRDGERPAENPGTRHEAKALLADWLAAARGNGERVLVGFDFPFGYPAGFAARLGLAGPPWRAVWDEIARLIEDGQDNKNNRFQVGAALNRRVSGAQFPFWGCPVGAAGRYLAPTRPSYDDGLAEKRLIDTWMVGAQPCWKLFYTGSVGGQVLTGIPVVRALRDDPRWADDAESGHSRPDLALATTPVSSSRRFGHLGGRPEANSVRQMTRPRFALSPNSSRPATAPGNSRPCSPAPPG